MAAAVEAALATPTAVQELTQGELDLSTVPRLQQNFPNPFNSSTMIRYQIAEPGFVRLDIHDLTGRRVVQLINGFREPGIGRIPWEGRNDQGDEVATGVYFAWLRGAGFAEVKKMVMMK